MICHSDDMGHTERIRARSAQTLGVVMVVASVVGVVSAALGGVDVLLRFGAPLALFGLFGWAAFWQPYVEVSEGGVVVANTLRTVEVPWPAVDEVDGRYGLTLRTAYGVVSAWAAPSPTGRQRFHGGSGRAAEAVETRLEALRAAGHLDDRRLERPHPRTQWHVLLLVAMGVLVVASVLLPLLA